MIGTPLTALALLQLPGPESWHPNPAFLYAAGAAHSSTLGLTTSRRSYRSSARLPAALGSKARERRVIGSGPKAGEEFDVTVPSHVSASPSSSPASLRRPCSLRLSASSYPAGGQRHRRNDAFSRSQLLRRRDRHQTARREDWETVATTTAKSFRGTGVLEMARALREGRPHRAQGALAYHVLDTMIAIAESVESRAFVDVASSVDKPPLPRRWDPLAETV